MYFAMYFLFDLHKKALKLQEESIPLERTSGSSEHEKRTAYLPSLIPIQIFRICGCLVVKLTHQQGFGSGSLLDPDSIRRVDPDPGGQKLPTKVKKIKKFHVLKKSAGCSLLRAEGFFVTWTSFMEA
jgi:hypothetical protein